jgi:hypothetical protein
MSIDWGKVATGTAIMGVIGAVDATLDEDVGMYSLLISNTSVNVAMPRH